MKRLVIIALVGAGCGNAEQEKELAALTAEETALKQEVGDAAQVLATQERVQDEANARLTRAMRSLSNLQAVAARRWEGNSKKLAELKKANPMPAPLLAALDTAHAAGKDLTPEKRFEHDVAAGKLTDAAALLDGWEAAEYSYEEPEEKDEAGCAPAEVPPLTCRQDGKHGILLCDAPENTWVIWSERGALMPRLAPAAGLEVAERPAPGIWVFRAKTGARNLFETRDGTHELTWVVTLPAKSQVTWKNIDEDPFPEGVMVDGADVRLLDVHSAHSVTAESELDSCRLLAKLNALPEGAKAGCASREKAAASGSADAGH